jgi:hypothetical protein
MLAAGTPVCAPHYAYVEAHARRCGDTTLDLLSALDRIDLPAQDHWLLRAGSLQLRAAHLPRISEWEYEEQPLQDLEDKALANAFAIMDRQPQRGICMFREQMTLPRRLAGLGLCSTSTLECHAAYMSAAARAQIVMSEGPEAFQPLLGSSAAGLAYKWAALRADAAALETWGLAGSYVYILAEERSWHVAAASQGAYI